ncbi:MAG: YdeI/OmpD-associated family protein [Acidimicrobiales bacterium]|nr:YdeI/OmpD-associated family protein [Acidimicrobiales bacterium]
MADVNAELIVASAPDWSRWLDEHGASSAGVWLVLAKKGTTEPTSVTYDDALEVAICHGWVDGQLAKRDQRTFRRKFTPRRRGGAWSKRNVAIAIRLTDEGRMKPAGLNAAERAKADGSWDTAYEGQSSITVPTDLAASLAANPAAKATFDQLDATNRYAVLYRVSTAKRAETRQRRIEQFVSMLARGETIHPRQRRRS